jgi:probable phosphoglycerate mutase
MRDVLTLLLMRHGEIPQEEPRRYVGRRDLPLTETGRAQASAWAGVLAGVPLAGAWCSDLLRCRETAGLALAGTDLAAVALPGLRELSLGEWEGLTEAEVRERFPGEFERRGADLARVAPTGGESFVQAQRRFCAALEESLPPRGIALVVAHAGVNRACLCRALGLPPADVFRLGQDYGCLNVLEIRPDAPARLKALNLPPGSALPPLA